MTDFKVGDRVFDPVLRRAGIIEDLLVDTKSRIRQKAFVSFGGRGLRLWCPVEELQKCGEIK